MPRTKKQITETDLVAAATNSPALAKNSFQLGDTTYPLLDLAYDNYIVFMTMLEPVLMGMAGKFATNFGFSPTTDFSSDLIKSLAKDLPEMVSLMCKQTNPDITASDVKAVAKSPFQLAGLVIKQIDHNKMIDDISAFFAQILPLFKLTPQTGTQSEVSGTPSE